MSRTLSELRRESRSAAQARRTPPPRATPPPATASPATTCDTPTAPPRPSRFTGRRVHFIGIGGCGMSALANVLLDSGAIVTGSEPKPNDQTLHLARRGAKISRDQLGELLSPDVDLVVRTAAIPEHNPEYLAARAMGLPQLKYAQLLGQVMQERLGVAVAGTHGKSTTTAMISHALLACGADPSFVIGGTVPQLGGGSRSGTGESFVVEACEFSRSFHHLHPRVALITNIEADHLDCYKDLDDIVESFRAFAALVPPDGLIVANGTDPNVRRALAGLAPPVQTVAVDREATWSTRTLAIERGCYQGRVLHEGRPVATLRLSVAGAHNLFNATAAVAACAACGVDPARAADAVGGFTGVDRRMTQVGTCNGAVVIDDYGHHPTEIRVTLRALREKYRPRRLLCVFQPHQHSRTRYLLGDFATSFADADETIVPDIYYSRDNDDEKSRVHAADLVARIVSEGRRAARHLPEFSAIVKYLRGEVGKGDLVVTMGAGNVWEVGRMLTEPALP